MIEFNLSDLDFSKVDKVDDFLGIEESSLVNFALSRRDFDLASS